MGMKGAQRNRLMAGEDYTTGARLCKQHAPASFSPNMRFNPPSNFIQTIFSMPPPPFIVYTHCMFVGNVQSPLTVQFVSYMSFKHAQARTDTQLCGFKSVFLVEISDT